MMTTPIMRNLHSLRSSHRLSALRLAAFLATGVIMAPVLAQPIVIPPAAESGVLQQRQIEEDRRRREQERLAPVAPDPLRRPDAPVVPQVSPSASAVRFEVREIRFTPSEILAPADLEAIAAQYRGRQVSLADLQELAAKVNALYQARGVVTAIAIIGPQDISAGVVEVRLVEGKVGEVDISGNATTRKSYIQARLGLVGGEIVDLNKLEDSLVWFNLTNDVRLEASLQSGKNFGSTDILVNAVEPDQHQLLATLDNLGSPMTGRWRAGISYRNRSLLGFRDDLALAYTYAEGQDSGSVGYGFPLNRWGGRINYSYYDDATSIRNGPLASLKITGRSHAHVLSLRQPVYVKNDLQIDLTAGAKKRDSNNYIDSVFLQRTDTTDASIGVEAQGADEKSLWGVGINRAHGTSKTLDTRMPFKVTKGSLRYNRDVADGWSLRSNAVWQYAKNGNLAASEQFLIGGEGSVRGYDVGVYSGDQGYTVNVELHHRIGVVALAGRNLAATGFLFVDHGRVEPFRPPNSLLRRSEHLTGLGYGVNASLGKQTSVRMTLAHGIDPVPQGGKKNMVFSIQLLHSLF